MDPYANIERQVELATQIMADERDNSDATELAELVLALVQWRLNGGFDPHESYAIDNANLDPDDAFPVEFGPID